MDKKLLAIILGILVGSLITSPTFSFAQKEADSDKPKANCDAYEGDENKLSDENKKVIVIGAGISGLATAHHLHCKGYDVVVFEARDRIGGRIFTDNSFGVALDRGASWIHGIEKSPVYELAVNNGMSVDDDLIKTDQSSYVVYNSEGQEITQAADQVWSDYNDIFPKFVEDVQANGTADSFRSAVQSFIDKNVIEEDRDEFFYYLYWQYELDDAADDVSFYRSDFHEYPDIEVIFSDGYEEIIKILASGLDIETEHPVTEIEYNGPQVNVSTEGNNEPFVADYVVSTLPLGVLQNDIVNFVPSINDSSSSKQHAIDSLGMGAYNKVYFIFNEDNFFWEINKYEDWIIRMPPANEKGQWMVFLNLYKYTGKPILLAFNSGSYSKSLNENNDEDIVKKGLQVLDAIYDQVPPIDDVKYIVTKWEQEKYSGGSFSYYKDTATPEDFIAMAEPLKNPSGENKVFFAGEATIQWLFSTVNGAYVSGIREAEKIQKEDGIMDSPKGQYKYGIHPTTIVCKDNHELLIELTDSLEEITVDTEIAPLCVKTESKDELIKRLNTASNALVSPHEFPFEELDEVFPQK